MTTAASAAFGISAMNGASSSRVASAPAAVTSCASWVFAPARRLTAVCDVPPPAGIAPNRPPPTLASPRASNSRLGTGRGSCGCANARPAAIDSVKLISAMPTAAGHICRTISSCGQVNDGRPRGTSPTIATPAACSPSNAETTMAAATASSGAGALGRKRSRPKINARMPSDSSTVTSDDCGRCCTIASTSRKKPVLSMWMPSSFGTWSTTITRPMPDLNPVSTGSEMKFATKPSRSTVASTSTSPTMTDSVAAATASSADPPPGAARARADAVRIAMVVVVLTLRGRDVPSSA